MILMLADAVLPWWQETYVLKAMGVCTLVGLVCGFLSGFTTLKGWSLMGDALSHSVVPGVAVAWLAGLPCAAGAFVSGLLAAAAMGFVKLRTRLREDAIMGIVMTSFFALGILLSSLYPSQVDLKTIIYGNANFISSEDAWQLVGLSAVTLGILALKWRDLMLYCFDPAQARTMGLPVTVLHCLLLAMLSACAVAALQAVGAILVVAMLVTPGATAYLLTDRFGRLLWLSGLLGGGTGFAGVVISYHLDTVTGGTIAVLQTLLFLAALIFAPRHGWLAARRARTDRRAQSAD